MEAFHHHRPTHHHHHEPRRPWSGLSRKASSNGVAEEKTSSRVLNYAEIFAGFSSSCSIPVLDLPPAPEEPAPCGPSIDYSGIFGGFDPGDFGIPYEELVASEKAGNGAPSGSSKETGLFFPVDFLLEPAINESNRDNNKVVGKKQFSSNGDSQHASSVFEAENQSNKLVKSGTVHENKFHSVSGNSYLPVGNAAEGETGNTVACSSATDYVATNSVPLRSYNNIKGSEDGVVVSQEENRQLYNSPEAVQINEQYHSCSSSENSVSEDNSIPDISNNDRKKQNVVDASSSEVNSFTSSKSEFLTNTINPTNDSRAVGRGSDSNTVSSEGVYSSEVMFASSSINFSLGAGSFQNQSVDGCSKIPNSKGGMVDKLTPSTSYVLEKVIGGQSGAFTASKNILAYDQEYVNLSKSTTLFPERSNDPTPFLKVSDINLRTEPCQVPPPSRPPPKLSGNQVFPKVMMAKSKSNVRCDAVTKPHNEAAKRDDQSSFYVEMNAGSAAAASVAEAMEQAQARLRSAKELMRRKKDTFHSRKKSTVDEMVKLETKVDGVTLVDGGKCHTEEMVFAGRESSKATAGQKVAADEGVVHEAMGRKKDSFHNRKKSSNETTKLETNVELPKMVDEIIEETYIFVTSGMCHTEKPFLSDHRPETIEVQKVVAYNCDLGNEVRGTKNSFHSRNNSLVEKTKLETKVEGPIIVDEIFEKINISDISGKCHDEKKVFTSGDRSIAAEAQKIAADHPLFPQKESTTSQLQISPSGKPDVGQWKVGEQFFEFVNNDKSFKKSPDASNSEPCKSVGNASVVITETDNSDNEKAKLLVMQEENNDYFVDSASELDTNDGTNARTVRYDGFSSDFEVLNVYTSTFEKLKVAATSSEVETLKVATEDVSDVSLHGNDEKLCNLFDSLQKQCGQDNENAKEQQFRNSEVYNHEDSHEVEESFDTFKCKVRSVEDCDVKIAEVPLQSSQFGEMHNAAPEMDCKGNENILNVPPYMDFELPEISKELEKPICSYKDSNKEEYLEEFRETSSEACLCEEVTISEKGEAVDEKDDKKTSVDTLEAYELVDENKPNVADVSSLHCTMGERISDLTDNEKHGGVEEFVLWSDSEQEKQTKEPCWQYFCEKIIGKAETVLHEGDGSQIGTGLNQQMHEVNLQDGIERSHGTKVNKTSKCSEPSVTFDGKPYWNSQGGDTLKASEQASCGVDNMEAPDAAKQSTPKEFLVHAVKTEEKDTGSTAAKEEGMNIPETSKNAEQLEDLRDKRESELEKERMRKLEEEKEREREREKDRQAVEGAIHGSRERAFAEARERAERAAVERVTAEARQRALAEAREKAEKASNEALLLAEKASREAKLRAERAAVERATAEVRERAVERALAEKAAQEAKERTERSGWQWKENGTDYAKDNIGTRKNTDFFDYRDTRESQKYSNSSNHVPRSSDRQSEGESAMRSKARLERHQRTVERAAKALAEKNLRDTLAQREQAERNRLAETLDAEVKRWSSGKEGNLRALLSTLQYILGPESGWQPIPLTEVITAAAVKKAYRKATLYVHPDKLQQRGANIQQKYVCEKVFDLLKEAWNRFNSEER